MWGAPGDSPSLPSFDLSPLLCKGDKLWFFLLSPRCQLLWELGFWGEGLILMLKAPDISTWQMQGGMTEEKVAYLRMFLPPVCGASDRKAREAEPAQPGDPINNSSIWMAAGNKALTVCLLPIPALLGKTEVPFSEQLFTIRQFSVIHKPKAKKKEPQCKMP